MLFSMISGDKKTYFEFVKKLFEESVDPRTFINSIIEYIRVVLMIKSGIDEHEQNGVTVPKSAANIFADIFRTKT